jgi:hypothetical protein
VDARARRVFGKRFLELSSEQQLDLVKALNRAAFQAAPGAAALDEGWDAEDVGRESFFRTLKELVLVGYYTSEVGATQELAPNPLGSWRADIPYAEVGHVWP